MKHPSISLFAQFDDPELPSDIQTVPSEMKLFKWLK